MTPPLSTFLICYLLSVAGAFCEPSDVAVAFGDVAGCSTCFSCLFVAAWFLIIGRAAKLLVVPLVICLCLIVGAKAFLNLVMNMGEIGLGTEWIGILLNSSWAEIGEFLEAFVWRSDVVVGAVALILPTAFFVWMIIKGRCRGFSFRRMTVGLLLMVPFVLVNIRGAAEGDSLSALLFDVRFHCNPGQGYDQYREIAKACRNRDFPAPPRYIPRTDDLPVFVIVVGESATRNHWGLYGYDKDTTPSMSALSERLMVFRNAESTHPFTAMNLKRIFTDATVAESVPARYAFPQLLKAAGYETELISAQCHWSEYDGVDAIMFESCDTKVFLSDVVQGGTYYDDAVLPYLTDALSRRRTSPLVVFVHLQGSHFLFASRYPSSFAIFEPSDPQSEKARRVAEYDNSIAFTDMVLGRIVDAMRSSPSPSAMIYFSDHGESFGSEYRSMSDPDMRDVPMVVWCSESYRSAAPDVVSALQDAELRRFGTDCMLRGLSRLCWLEWEGFPADMPDFLSDPQTEP